LQVGFEMVDALADAEGISMNTVNFKALFGKGSLFHSLIFSIVNFHFEMVFLSQSLKLSNFIRLKCLMRVIETMANCFRRMNIEINIIFCLWFVSNFGYCFPLS